MQGQLLTQLSWVACMRGSFMKKDCILHAPGMKVIATLVACACLASTAMADYPERRVQLVYPLTTGTPTYRVSQIIAAAMGAELGVQIIAAAKPGASGADALVAALREPADGYTVIDAYVAPLIISPLFGRVPYSCQDFIPLYSATATALGIASRKDETRWTDMASFVKYLKLHPGATRYSAGGELSMPHLVAAKLLKNLNVVSRHITFADLQEGVVELHDGNLDWLIVNPGMYQDAKDKFRVLAVIGDAQESTKVYDDAKRTADLGIPLGLDGLASKPWDWWLVKKGTPDAIVEKLRSAMAKALAQPAVQAQLTALGYLPTRLGPQQFQATCEHVTADLRNAMGAIEWEKAEAAKLK
jgi:tripartite-type tricarboxylate transporter receptor subunit TctC